MNNKADFVLLIDDEESTNFLHQIIVDEANITDNILTARNGNEGLTLLKKSISDGLKNGIVFLDINMPGMDGWTTLEEIEKIEPEARKKITIVMVSASDYPKDIERVNQHPMVETYMPKPLTIEKVTALITGLNA